MEGGGEGEIGRKWVEVGWFEGGEVAGFGGGERVGVWGGLW